MSEQTSLVQKVVQEISRDCTTFGSILFTYIVALIFLMQGLPNILVSLIIIDIIGQGTKYFFPTKRPDKESYSGILEKMRAGSFPSVHSARVTFLGIFLIAWFPDLILRVGIAIIAIAAAASRVVLKRHYIRDVVGGIVLGAVVFFLPWFIL